MAAAQLDLSEVLKSDEAWRNEALKDRRATYAKVNEVFRQAQAARKTIAESIFALSGDYPDDYLVDAPAPGTNGKAPKPVPVASGDRDKRVLEVLSQNKDGINGTELAKAVGVSAATVRTALDGLIEDGKVKRTGEKRATLYFPAPKS